MLGSTRKQLIRQFIGENLLVGCLALSLGLFLASTLILPTFTKLIDFYQLQFNLLDNWRLIVFLLGPVLAISLLSGLYPSVYISGFRTQGEATDCRRNGLLRTLLVLQFGLSMLTVSSAILTTQNAQFLRRMDIGYDKSGLVVLRVNNEQSFNQLRDAAIRLPDVTKVAGSQDQIGRTGDNIVTLEDGPIKSTTEVLRVSADCINTVGLQLTQGRNFLTDR